MKQFISILLGNQSPAEFAALFFYALLGAFLSILLQTTSRDPLSDRTPLSFRWSFLVRDNGARIVAGLLLIPLSLRFAPEIHGVEITPFWALAIGLGNDKLAQFLKSKVGLPGGKAAAAVIILLFFSGCSAQRKAEKYYRDHPEQLAKQCAEQFPVRDSVAIRDSLYTDTLLLDPVFITDTVYLNGNPLVLNKKCPASKIVTQTQVKTVEHFVRDMANEKVLQTSIEKQKQTIALLEKQLASKEEKVQGLTKGRNAWRIATISFLLLLGISIWLFRKFRVKAAQLFK